MGEFNSDDHYMYYCGQESIRRNGVAIMVNKRVQNAVLGCSLKNDVLFIILDWNAKVGSQETPGLTGKFGLGMQNEAGQRLIEFGQENALVIANNFFQHPREDSTHGHHQIVNTEIRLIIFAAKDGEALYNQQKQGRELTVAQIMNSLLPNSDLN